MSNLFYGYTFWCLGSVQSPHFECITLVSHFYWWMYQDDLVVLDEVQRWSELVISEISWNNQTLDYDFQTYEVNEFPKSDN